MYFENLSLGKEKYVNWITLNFERLRKCLNEEIGKSRLIIWPIISKVSVEHMNHVNIYIFSTVWILDLNLQNLFPLEDKALTLQYNPKSRLQTLRTFSICVHQRM